MKSPVYILAPIRRAQSCLRARVPNADAILRSHRDTVKSGYLRGEHRGLIETSLVLAFVVERHWQS